MAGMIGDAVVFKDDTWTFDDDRRDIFVPEGTVGLVVQRRDELRSIVATGLGLVHVNVNHIVPLGFDLDDDSPTRDLYITGTTV
jgi:hypothetical protein